MKKFTVFIGCILWILPFIGAYAVPPPPQGDHPAGWGMNPTVWELRSSSFTEWGIYDPLENGSGAGAYSQGVQLAQEPPEKQQLRYRNLNPRYPAHRPVNSAPIFLELWIESYMLLTYECTGYQWHRLGDANETIVFLVQGTTQSNTEIQVTLMPGTDPLTHIKFVEDIYGRGDPQFGSDLEINWRARWGSGLLPGENVQWGWQIVTPESGTGVLGLSQIPPCDHWFQFEGSFEIPYHQPDGYYRLVINGCPVLVM